MNELESILHANTVDQLKPLLAFFPGAGAKLVRKADLVNTLLERLSGTSLRAVWDGLDATQKLAVSEALYSWGGEFRPAAFEAKYGALPRFHQGDDSKKYSRTEQGPKTALWLLLHSVEQSRRLPAPMQLELKAYVPEPAPTTLKLCDALPDAWEGAALTVRECEREAPADLAILLHLVDQGKILVGDKTGFPSGTTTARLGQSLSHGDYYPVVPPKDKWEQVVGPIKAFSWPLLLQASGLVQKSGTKLSLSPAGFKALGAAPETTLRTLFQKWQKSSLLDEFSRVDAVQGQKSDGRPMAAVPPRRAAVADALRVCPVGQWVAVDDLSRYMQADGLEFDVANDPWKLYIGERKYGALGYQGSHEWHILQLRYLLCVLFEYLAPLGMIDVAYVPPDGARPNFGGLWGTDDFAFLSQYDGLTHIRLTALGAYCLGMAESYAPTAVSVPVGARLSVLPSLRINVVSGQFTTEEAMQLEAWAVEVTPGTWQLDRQKALLALERGHDAAALLSFLAERDAQGLPETVESFVKTTQKQSQALKLMGMARLLRCQDAETAELIATHKETAGLCLRAGDRMLVVAAEHVEKFRNQVRVLGLGIVG